MQRRTKALPALIDTELPFPRHLQEAQRANPCSSALKVFITKDRWRVFVKTSLNSERAILEQSRRMDEIEAMEEELHSERERRSQQIRENVRDISGHIHAPLLKRLMESVGIGEGKIIEYIS